MPAALSIALRALIALQGWRTGDRAPALQRAARLPTGDENAAIDTLRRRLASDDALIDVEDHGAGTRGALGTTSRPAQRTVADIYGRAAATPGWGRFLAGLAREIRPRRVLELGTNLGVSAAHIASALSRNADGGRLWSIEGDPGLASLARENLRATGLAGHVEVIEGRFDDVLPRLLDGEGPFDMVFVDGHHEEAATLRYWAMIRGHLAPGAAVLFDDIEPGRPVRRAWRRIVRDDCPRIEAWVDLIGLGILFLRGAGRDIHDGRSDLSHGQ